MKEFFLELPIKDLDTFLIKVFCLPILVFLILSGCQNIENGKKNTFPKKEKENSINMNSTISEIEIKN